ncbi:MAG: hypothetical protein H6709_25035 [Kofleriaceae bacterium]|nr:hypothetical protein [Kofleriaceae bacterium]MCB9575355.1 hypothetical protein [Kofleriaceae bacterium]
MDWEVEITAARLPALQREIEWAMQRQNLRFADAMRARRLPMARRRQLIVLLGLLGLGLLGFLAVTYPAMVRAQPAFFVAFTALFGLALAAGVALSRVQAWSRRVAGRMLSRRVARMLAPLWSRAPLTATYRLDGATLRTSIPTLGVARTDGCGDAAVVLSTPGVVLLFRRRHALNPARCIYVAGPAERDAVVAAFVAAGAAHEHLAGPVDGYLDPLPPARVVDGP